MHAIALACSRKLQASAGRQRTVLGQQVWSAMRRLQTHVALVYCQGHVQNEAADEAVKAAAKGGPGDPSEDPTPIPYGVTATVLAQHFRRLQADEARHDDGHWAKICRDGPPKWKEHEAMTRAEQHILAQLRATKCSLLADYRHLCGWAESPACECGAPVQNVEHVRRFRIRLSKPLHGSERK